MRFDLGASHTVDSSDAAHFYLHDEAGNVIAVADKTGSLESHFEHDAWGNDLGGNFTTNAQDVRRFRTGKFFDDVTGLYYNQARWYDPTLGRFISESPIAPFVEEDYAYCGNDPVNRIDNNGLWNFWNPATYGEPNAPDWTPLDSLNPFHPSSGYHTDTISESTKKGLAAFADGLIRFFAG